MGRASWQAMCGLWRPPVRDAAELARRLAARAPALAAELLPHGVRDGQEWRAGSLAGERGRSLAVHLSGDRAGVWSDFASGESGDALDLVAARLYRGDKRLAMDWARQWLGLSGTHAASPRLPDAPAPVADDADALAEAERKRGSARRMWLAGTPLLPGTPAALYLAGRGIDLADLPRVPGALRSHAGLFNREGGEVYPAMVAAIVGPDGRHAATHRTWLHCAAGRWVKAPLRDPKMTLGRLKGGCIPLARRASGMPLARAPEGETVAIAEGIETALSVAVACPELRVLCAVSIGNMATITLPAAVRDVILCADNDGDNPSAARALQRAIESFAAQGRTVRIARSPHGKDFNDALRAECAA